MQYQYIPYIWPLITSALISLSLGLYALLRRRNAKGAISFILNMFFVTLWSAANALEMSSIDFSTKLFWANVQYIAYGYAPVTWLVLCMQFTGYDKWLNKGKVFGVAVVPAIIVLLVWTDGMHGLIRYNMQMDYSGAFPVISKEYGIVFYIHAIYAHSLCIIAWIMLFKELFSRNAIYRRQATALIIAIGMIIISNLMYISGFSPFKRFDITPVVLGPAGLIIAWGIFRYKIFEVIPVARATVIETMEAGVMVLDLQNRVIDINPYFEKIIGLSASIASGRLIEEMCGNMPNLLNACKDRSINHCEFSLQINQLIKDYEVLLSPLTDDDGMLIGRLVVINDITERKIARQKYITQQRKLAVSQERERFARDMHDNLGQILGFINLQAQGIRQELMNSGIKIVLDKLDKLVDVTQAAHNELREYIKDSRTEESKDKDFLSELSMSIIRFEKQTGMKVELELPTDFSWNILTTTMRTNILNIIKEALNNIRKHAQAKQVQISFSLIQEQLLLKVEDNGIGFDVVIQDGESSNKYGLSIMRERAFEIGAKLEIDSVKHRGSRILLWVPLIREERINANEINAG